MKKSVKIVSMVLAAAMAIGLGIAAPQTEVQAATKITNSKVYNKHTYSVINTAMTWTDAEEACEKMGGHLVAITSASEEKFVEKLIKQYGTQYHFWIGLTDVEEEGTWEWVTGEKFSYSNWRYDEPNNDTSVSSSGQDYALIHHSPAALTDGTDYDWADMPDSGKSGPCSGSPYYYNTQYYGYVCEWDYRISDTSITLDSGDAYKLCLYDAKDNVVKATYKSSNPAVAKVSSTSGKLIAVSTGKCTITAVKNGVQFKCTVTVKPGKVTGIKNLTVNKTSLQLQWTKQSGATGYKVMMYDPDFKEWTAAGSSTTNRITVKNLHAGTKYKFKVRAYIKSGSSKYFGEYSKVYTVTTKK